MSYIRDTDLSDMSYNYIEKKIENIYEEDEIEKIEVEEEIEVDEIFLRKKDEQFAQYYLRMKLFKIITNIDLENYNLPEELNSEGEEMHYILADKASMKIAELLLNKLWYNVKYTSITETFIDLIMEQVQF